MCERVLFCKPYNIQNTQARGYFVLSVRDCSGKPGTQRSEVRTCNGKPGPQGTPQFYNCFHA